jgi:hypothetical protein
MKLAVAVMLAFLVTRCGSSRPKRLLNGEAAAGFGPVHGSVLSIARVLDAVTLGGRFSLCADQSAGGDFTPGTVVVERIGVFSESLTFRERNGKALYACDGGVDPAGEHRPPWCGGSVGVPQSGRLLDPRLDVLCRTKEGHPLAYAWIEPVPGSRWIGVDQGSYTEVYEVLAGLPARVATRRNIHGTRAGFDVTQYDIHGRELVRGRIEAAVAG